MIEINREEIKETLSDYSERIKGYSNRMSGFRGSMERTMKRSMDDHEKLEGLLTEVDEKIGRASQGIDSVKSLMKYKADKKRYLPVSNWRKERPLALELVQSARVADNHSFWGRLPFVRSRISIDRALIYIRQGLERAPGYVNEGLKHVEEVYHNMTEYKAGLREKINDVADGRGEVVGIRDNLRTELINLHSAYTKLEDERKKAAENQTRFSDDKLDELRRLDTLMGECRDTLTNAELELEEGDSLIGMLNGQIEKLDEYQLMSMNALKVIRKGKAFIDLHVPYAIQEIEGQRAIGMGVAAVNRVVNMIGYQHEVSGRLNDLLDEGVRDVNKRIELVKEEVVTPHILGSGRKVAGLLGEKVDNDTKLYEAYATEEEEEEEEEKKKVAN